MSTPKITLVRIDRHRGRRMWLDRAVAEQWQADVRAWVLARRGMASRVERGGA